MNINDIKTPALIIDMNVLEKNIKLMADFLSDKKTKLRPHFKSAKITDISKMQLDAGAIGITCAKVSEAKALYDAGIRDILIANQIIDEEKMAAAAAMAKEAQITVLIDDAVFAEKLNATAKKENAKIGCLIELNVGMDRMGVDTAEEVLEIAKEIIKLDNLEFKGIQAYEGHCVLRPERDFRQSEVEKMHRKLEYTKELLNKNGIDIKIISGGGTGTYDITGAMGLYDELQAGSYIYMDTKYDKVKTPFEKSLSVLAQIIKKRNGITILDCGLKSFSMENGIPVVKGYEDAAVKMSEEHMKVFCNMKEEVGEKIRIYPTHCCTQMNIFDKAYGVRNGQVERIFKVDGRGKSE